MTNNTKLRNNYQKNKDIKTTTTKKQKDLTKNLNNNNT